MIDSFEELAAHRFEEIPGSPHTRWVPWIELREKCTPRYIEEHERHHREFMEQYRRNREAYVRGYIAVTVRKYRARKRRR